MGLFTLNRIRPKPIRMPTTTSGHAMSPPTMPCASEAIRPACGAEQLRRAERCRRDAATSAGRTAPCWIPRYPTGRRSAFCAGVPPRMWPTLRSCSISPATADETQTTAATPSTAAMPQHAAQRPSPPSAARRSPAVDSVRPEMGLFDEPIMPTRLPETAAKKKPRTIMTSAATTAAPIVPAKVDVERDHADEHHGQPAEDHLAAQVALGAAGGFVSCRRLLQVGDRALHADAQVLAHAEQGEGRAHHHAAYGDGAHDVEPDGAGRPWPSHLRARRQLGASCGPRKKISSGTSSPQANTPPAKFSAPSSAR